MTGGEEEAYGFSAESAVKYVVAYCFSAESAVKYLVADDLFRRKCRQIRGPRCTRQGASRRSPDGLRRSGHQKWSETTPDGHFSHTSPGSAQTRFWHRDLRLGRKVT